MEKIGEDVVEGRVSQKANELQLNPLRREEWLERILQGDLAARGVVLRRKEDSSGSQELLLFLEGFGAMQVGAKNRFGAGTEPMTWGEFRLYRSPRRVYLKGVDMREGFWSVRKSPKALSVATRWLKALADRLPPGHENDPLLSLLWGCLRNLSAGVDPLFLDVRFFWRWCNLWGLAPRLDRCSSCDADIASLPSRVLHMSLDGLLCPACRRSEGRQDTGALRYESLEFLLPATQLARENFLKWVAQRTPGDPAVLESCSRWLRGLLAF